MREAPVVGARNEIVSGVRCTDCCNRLRTGNRGSTRILSTVFEHLIFMNLKVSGKFELNFEIRLNS